MADNDMAAQLHQQQQMQQAQTQQHIHTLQLFWQNQMQEIEQMTDADFKRHRLPLARVKKIMKSDEDVRMISAEAPCLFAKACEIFIRELTLRSWIHTDENKRKTLQRNDIAMAITKTDIFDFLIDIVPRDDLPPSNKMGTEMISRAPLPTELQHYPHLFQQPTHTPQAPQQPQPQTLPTDPSQLSAGLNPTDLLLYQQAAQQQQLQHVQNLRYLHHTQLMHQLQMQNGQLQHDTGHPDNGIERPEY